jgi:polyhydroxyalkanoate synthesis regulator phasin
MFYGALKKGFSVQGYIDKGLVEIDHLYEHHEELVKEMQDRGMNHQSSMQHIPDEWIKKYSNNYGTIVEEKSINDLRKRCKDCTNKL